MSSDFEGNDLIGSFEELERRLVEWAAGRDDVRTMLIVGSRARPGQADEWSDLDVAFTTTSRAPYLADTRWLEGIGEVWVAYADPHGATRHVLFAGGLDAGIAPLPHGALRVLPPVLALRASPAFRVVPRRVRSAVDRQLDELLAYTRRGVRLLVDKDGLGAKVLAALPPASGPEPPPGAQRFRAVVDEFWFLAVWNAKHLRRGELWATKTVACDGRMKDLVLRMVAWHARAQDGRSDIWQDGRHLEEWADASVVADLGTAFGHYDEDDLWRASLATMDLFRRLATDTAERLGLAYPIEADARVTAWVVACEAGRRNGA